MVEIHKRGIFAGHGIIVLFIGDNLLRITTWCRDQDLCNSENFYSRNDFQNYRIKQGYLDIKFCLCLFSWCCIHTFEIMYRTICKFLLAHLSRRLK